MLEGEYGEVLFIIFSYVFCIVVDVVVWFVGEVLGNVYLCYINFMVCIFEECIVVFEGVEQVVVMVLGMLVIFVLVMSLCSFGDYVLVLCSVFGLIISLFDKYFKCFGIQVDYLLLSDFVVWEVVCKLNIKLFFVELLFNLLVELVDIVVLVEIVYVKGVLLVVDNCFCMLVL